MDGLIKRSGSKYEEYEEALLERDQIEKEAGQIWTAYLKTFGKLITDVYEEKLECVKCKKIISFYQSALNRGGDVDPAAMERYLKEEMADYYANLKKMLDDNKEADNAEISSPYEVQRSKVLYRRLAKLIHPDIHPETDALDQLKELWQRIVTAYHANSVKELSELEVLVRRTLKENGEEGGAVDVPDIEDKIAETRRETEEIKSNEPYSLKILLEDPEATEKKKSELTKELEEYRGYRKELNGVIVRMMEGGGLKIHVE